MMNLKLLAILAINLLFLCNSFGQDVEGSSDHEIVGRYPGAEIQYYYQKEYSELEFPQKIVDGLPSDVLKAKGKHTSILYAAPKNISPLEIFRNYESAIKKSKGKIIFSCQGKYSPDGCDDYNSFYALKFFTANYYEKRHNNTDQYVLLNGSDDQAYLVALFENATSKIFVEVGIDGNTFSSQAGVQVEIVEQSKMQDGLITAQLFEEEMKKNGKIALYGILFDTGKSTLKPSSKHELTLIQEYLKNHPKENVYIVGHTDDTGKLESNKVLSKDRAQAVLNYLIENGISAGRMVAEGVGPFVPVSSNETEEGKKLNRRVEIVKRL